MRRLFCFVVFPLLAHAAIWPEEIGSLKRVSVEPAAVQDRAIWDEYGLKEAESATYAGEGPKFTATAYRLQDSTGAMAAHEWLRGTEKTVERQGNYVFVFRGEKPSQQTWDALTQALRNVDSTPLPALTSDLPDTHLVPGSERYILGPASLDKFYPGLPPSVAGFRQGAEAQIGVYKGPKGEMKLAIFNYPTPQIAMQKIGEFEKVPGVLAKRAGPLVAAIVSPPDADAAERLLAQVRYEAQVTLDERVPGQKDNPINMVWNAIVLAGILLAFCAASGLAFGILRAFWRRGRAEEADAMITLHLER